MVGTNPKERAMCQNLSKFKVPKTFDPVILLPENLFYLHLMCRNMCGDIIALFVIAETRTTTT